MRNISFALTAPQFKARTKDVTRRLGWLNVKPGDHLMGCEKCMGRKNGEPLVRLGEIVVTRVRRENLDVLLWCYFDGNPTKYALDEVRREGFPEISPSQFVDFFIASHKGCERGTLVTRLEFRYV